ncbi:MAG: T9SS type A sorting domain-containing protein [Bacteroidetes bacterium]|nr:T9SS type A sorting domain-containing protein [Bacteroidota bacterium]
MSRISLVVLFLFFSEYFPAQNVFFETYFGSGLPDCGRDLRQYSDSTIYEAGYTTDTIAHHTDVRLCKTDRFGNMLWTRTYGGSLDDDASGIEISSDGNLLMCGETYTTSNGIDALLMKVDTSGNILWQRNYGGPLNECINRMTVLADGKIAMTGFVSDAFSSNDIYVLVVDANGNYVWSANVGGMFNDVGHSICALPDSGFVVFGDTKRSAMADYNIEGVRFQNGGNILWDSTYSYNDTLADGCQNVILLSDGNLLLFGESQSTPFSWFDFLLHKIDLNGNTIWFRKQGGNLPDAAFSVCEVADGFIGTGYSQSYSPGPNNIIVFKTDTAGNLLWANPYGGPGIDIGYEIIPALGGGFFIGGTGNISGDDQFGLLHVDNGGWAGVEERSVSAIKIFPDPSGGNFSIIAPGKDLRVEIFSADGNLIFFEQTENSQGLMNIRKEFIPGIYFVRVNDGDEIVVKKLIVY